MTIDHHEQREGRTRGRNLHTDIQTYMIVSNTGKENGRRDKRQKKQEQPYGAMHGTEAKDAN